MNEFVNYLQTAKESLKNVTASDAVHIIIGNESCDLDSTVSSIALAYFLHYHKISEVPDSAIVVPVLNVSLENFLLRAENCFVLEECGIPLDTFIYRDQIDFVNLLKTSTVTVSLVDHHVLSRNDRILENNVIQIFDHRPVDPSSNWDSKKISIKIDSVGSCSTLIAAKILQASENILCKELAYMIYETMVYDTVGLLPENGRAKELDLKIADQLEKSRATVYEKVLKAHNDISHLTAKQILLKDLKIVDDIPVPGLPMLLQSYLKIKNAHEAIKSFSEDYNSTIVILIGLEAANKVKRDVGIYWKGEGEVFKDILLDMFKRSDELKGYNFCFSEMCTGYNDIICLSQNNIKLTRKHIIPIIRDANIN
ncbi:hypothetical protein NQ317_009626 [Molorchus minor]|uniref:DHHA2 domain-containing protein n=1 Tax=Molorchus minor TaxID=1323400 RepID=A0ABQ9JJ89_9CUCU|nr:hypothetical protein NQ317_009626 [Molorchus minor]